MLKHYLLTAKRSLMRHKAFTFINLLGLSLGLSSALMLFVFIYNQGLKDAHIPDLDRYVRVEAFTELRASEGFRAHVHPGVAPALLENLPQVEAYVRMNGLPLDVSLPEGAIQDQFVSADFLQVDPSFFEFFPQAFVLGNKATALEDKSLAVITEGMAQRLFGNENPIGQVIRTTQTHRNPLTISAVVKDTNPNSSIQFDFLLASDFDYGLSSAGFSPTSTYLKLLPNTPLDELTKAINETIAPLATGAYVQSFRYRLSTFEQVKYDLATADKVIKPVDQDLILIFTLVAVFILLLAVINYINLSASKALQRAREAGIRKMIGAGRASFFFQFVTESILLSLLAFPLAILFFKLAQPHFEAALNMSLAVGIGHPMVLSTAFSLVLITGLLAGSYPALLISRFKFHEYIKGNHFDNQKGAGFRRLLVVFQFAIAILLVICAVVVQQQLQFVQQQKLRYNPEQMVVLERGLSRDFNLLKDDLDRLPGVLQSSLTTSPPGGNNHSSSGDLMNMGEIIYVHEIDHHYAEMLNLEFVWGQNFDPEKVAENDQVVIINETLSRLISTANPKQLDKPLEGKYQFRFVERKIGGIVKDFHIQSKHEKIKPMVFVYDEFLGYTGARVMLNITSANIGETLKQVEAAWHEHVPQMPFRYSFLDQRFERLYSTETRLSLIFNAFTGIAITISCLGLYGLIAFMATTRSKEVGIRKVLGASVLQIVRLFTQKVVLLVLVSSLVAVPLAWWAMAAWLQGFAYHINISWTVFLSCIGGTLLIGGVAVIFKIVKSAMANPVEVLRSE